MADYQVELKPSAQKELVRLPDTLLARIVAKLEGLQTDPRPHGCKKLKGGEHEYRIRVNDYRIVYVINDSKRMISVTRIRHRSEVYD